MRIDGSISNLRKFGRSTTATWAIGHNGELTG